MVWKIILSAVLGYLLGCIPTGVLVARIYGVRDIRTLLDDADARQSMAEHMHALSVPDATEKIVGEILDLLHHTVL